MITLIHTKEGNLEIQRKSLQPIIEKVKLPEPEEYYLRMHAADIVRATRYADRGQREELTKEVEQIILNFYKRVEKHKGTVVRGPRGYGHSWDARVCLPNGLSRRWICERNKWITMKW